MYYLAMYYLLFMYYFDVIYYLNFCNSYIVEKLVVEEALKERHLIAKGVSPGYIDIIRV